MRRAILSALALLLLPSAVHAQAGACVDLLAADVAVGFISVHHFGAQYNCCGIFSHTVAFAGGRLVVTESEDLTNSCRCTCCYDLGLTIVDPPPGEYDLVLTWYDYEAQGWLELATPVIVPLPGQGDEPVVLPGQQPICSPTAVDPPLGSWGTLKAIYR